MEVLATAGDDGVEELHDEVAELESSGCKAEGALWFNPCSWLGITVLNR